MPLLCHASLHCIVRPWTSQPCLPRGNEGRALGRPSYGAPAPGASYLRQMPTMYPANLQALPPLPRVLASLPNMPSQPGYPTASSYTAPMMGAPQPHTFRTLPAANIIGMPALPASGQGLLNSSMQQLAGLYTAHANGTAGSSSSTAQLGAASGGAAGAVTAAAALGSVVHDGDRKRKAEEMLAQLSRPSERQQGASSLPVATASTSSIPQQVQPCMWYGSRRLMCTIAAPHTPHVGLATGWAGRREGCRAQRGG